MPADNTAFIIVAVVAALLLSMTLHEAMHAFTAYWLGDDTAKYEGRLSLNPLKHIDPFLTLLLPISMVLIGLPPFGAAKPVPFNPNRVKGEEFGAALVGVAGPLTNAVLAVVGALVFRALGLTDTTMLGYAVLLFVEVNVGFFVFNMIPFPPLDGSRLLYAFAPEPLQEVMRNIEGFGIMGIFIFFFIVVQFLQPALIHVNVSILNFLLG